MLAVEDKPERCSGLSAPGWMCLPHKVQHCRTNNPRSQAETASKSGATEQLKMSSIEENLNYLNPLLGSMQILFVLW